MERESFEDAQVATLLNDKFVAIKVDREERPDIDHIYMTVCQALTGQGGWPLSIVMTPNQDPFFAGTYFPKHSRHGHIGLLDLLTQLSERWVLDREKVVSASERLMVRVKPLFEAHPEAVDWPALVEEAYADFVDAFDSRYGGFGEAPKFPLPHQLMFLLRYGQAHGDDWALGMVCRTLDGMRQGGIYDHVGGGFSRYSTDEK